MRQNDRVILLREIKTSIDGSAIPEGAEGIVIAKIMGSGRNTFEVDFGEHGTAICDKNDLRVVYEQPSDE